MKPTINYSDFEKVDLIAGTIVEVEDFSEAKKPAYKLKIDFGPEIGIRKSSAQIKNIYSKKELIGRQVISVVNFVPKQIGGNKSEVLTLGFKDEKGNVILVMPEKEVPLGEKLH